MVDSALPILPVTVLVLGSYLIPLFRRRGHHFAGLTALTCLGLALGISCYFAVVAAGGAEFRYQVGGWAPPFGIEVRVGLLESLMLILITGVSFLVTIWSLDGLTREINPSVSPWYYTMLLLTTLGMIGMVMARDLFNLYVFIEVTGIGACALVASQSNRLATLAAFKYLALATIGSGFILFGIGMLYMVTGNLNYDFVSAEMLAAWVDYPQLVWVAVSFFLVGFSLKAALFPLHVWLPDAHSSAPSPSSAILSGLVVKAYAFSLIKVLPLFLVMEPQAATHYAVRLVILIMAFLAIIGGSAFALVQSKVKRLLAYSTVAQMGYIFLGIGIGTPLTLTAALFHFLAHALMKCCLFLSAGSMAQHTGAKDISGYDGMARRMPLTMGAFAVGALSMIGIPGFVGLVTKWYLAIGAMEAGLPVYAVLMVASGTLNAAYYLPILERAYFRPPREQPAGDEGPTRMLVPVVILAAGCIVLGVVPGRAIDLISRTVALIQF